MAIKKYTEHLFGTSNKIPINLLFSFAKKKYIAYRLIEKVSLFLLKYNKNRKIQSILSRHMRKLWFHPEQLTLCDYFILLSSLLDYIVSFKLFS